MQSQSAVAARQAVRTSSAASSGFPGGSELPSSPQASTRRARSAFKSGLPRGAQRVQYRAHRKRHRLCQQPAHRCGAPCCPNHPWIAQQCGRCEQTVTRGPKCPQRPHRCGHTEQGDAARPRPARVLVQRDRQQSAGPSNTPSSRLSAWPKSPERRTTIPVARQTSVAAVVGVAWLSPSSPQPNAATTNATVPARPGQARRRSLGPAALL